MLQSLGIMQKWPKASDLLFEPIRHRPRHSDDETLGNTPSQESLSSWASAGLVPEEQKLYPGKGQLAHVDASLTSKLASAPRRIEGKRLTVTGAECDHIASVSPATVGEVVEDIACFEDFMKYVSNLPDHYSDIQTRADVLWRVMIMDTEETLGKINHPASSSFGKSFQAWIFTKIGLWVAHVVREGTDLDYANERARQFFAQLYPNTQIEVPDEIEDNEESFTLYHRTLMLPFVHSIGPRTYGRRLFQTTGGLLGMGSQSIEGGDQVWLIQDSRTPLIVRPKPGTQEFLLVGEAYLHGFMRGEMSDEVRNLE
jgi:hypothetical protein